MRKVLLFVMLCMCLGVYAQEEEKQDKSYDCYCIVFWGKWSKGYVHMPTYDFDQALMQENGKKIAFKHSADLITYMSKRGWKYIDSTTYDNQPAYIMSKKVRNDEDMIKGLLLECDYENQKKRD